MDNAASPCPAEVIEPASSQQRRGCQLRLTCTTSVARQNHDHKARPDCTLIVRICSLEPEIQESLGRLTALNACNSGPRRGRPQSRERVTLATESESGAATGGFVLGRSVNDTAPFVFEEGRRTPRAQPFQTVGNREGGIIAGLAAVSSRQGAERGDRPSEGAPAPLGIWLWISAFAR